LPAQYVDRVDNNTHRGDVFDTGAAVSHPSSANING
jgi:hypothetical protein